MTLDLSWHNEHTNTCVHLIMSIQILVLAYTHLCSPYYLCLSLINTWHLTSHGIMSIQTLVFTLLLAYKYLCSNLIIISWTSIPTLGSRDIIRLKHKCLYAHNKVNTSVCMLIMSWEVKCQVLSGADLWFNTYDSHLRMNIYGRDKWR